MKNRLQASINGIIKYYTIPMNTHNSLGRISKNNLKIDLIIYVETLKNDETPYNDKLIIQPQSSRPKITILYDMNTANDFPHISQKYQQNKKQKEYSHQVTEKLSITIAIYQEHETANMTTLVYNNISICKSTLMN